MEKGKVPGSRNNDATNRGLMKWESNGYVWTSQYTNITVAININRKKDWKLIT